MAGTDDPFIPRLVLGLVVCALAVLVPGEAERFIESPMSWSDVWPQWLRGPRSVAATPLPRSGATPTPSGVV